jgi:hypothetical protein
LGRGFTNNARWVIIYLFIDLDADSFVPPAAAVLSGEDIVKSVRKTGSADCEFMKKIVNTNLTLVKGYLRLAVMYGVLCFS